MYIHYVHVHVYLLGYTMVMYIYTYATCIMYSQQVIIHLLSFPSHTSTDPLTPSQRCNQGWRCADRRGESTESGTAACWPAGRGAASRPAPVPPPRAAATCSSADTRTPSLPPDCRCDSPVSVAHQPLGTPSWWEEI